MAESQLIEYKQAWRDEYLKWICGFANAQGGKLYIGIDDKGEVIGVDNARKLLEDIPNKVRDSLGLTVEVNLLNRNQRDYLEIEVEPSLAPVCYKGQYHFRSGSTKQELRGPALDRFLLRRYGRSWDSLPIASLRIEDLNPKSIQLFRDRASLSNRMSLSDLKESDSDLLTKLRQYDGKQFNRSAVLLFHDDPERFITGAFVKIGYFETESELLYQDEIHGNIFRQVDETMDVLAKKYLKALIHYEGIQRVERYPIPLPALREAVLNAIVHKDYGGLTPVQIRVFKDKLMLWNYGTLPEEWTIDTFKQKHGSIPYNPNLANVLFRVGEIESWGRGIEKMVESCVAYGTSEPEFEFDGSGIWLTFHFSDVRCKTAPKTTLKTAPKTTLKNEEKILQIITDYPRMSRMDIAKRLQISKEAVRYNIRKLRDQGFDIQWVGASKSGHWQVVSKNE